MYSNIKYILFLFLFIFLSSPKTVNAQVVINEINPSAEWIELIRLTDTTNPSLDGCTIYFHNTESQKKLLTTTDSFLEGELYKVIYTGGSYLSNSSSDTVWLKCADFQLEQVVYPDNIGTKSYARIPDGVGSFGVTETITLASENPNPTPEPTQAPTQSPTQAPTSEPTKTATPTPAPTTKPTPTKTATAKPSPTEESISLLENQDIKTTDNSKTGNISEPEVLGLTTEKKKSPILSMIFLIAGIACLGYVGYLLYNGKHAKI